MLQGIFCVTSKLTVLLLLDWEDAVFYLHEGATRTSCNRYSVINDIKLVPKQSRMSSSERTKPKVFTALAVSKLPRIHSKIPNVSIQIVISTMSGSRTFVRTRLAS